MPRRTTSCSTTAQTFNVDFDFADVVDGQFQLKSLVQRDPSQTVTLLANLAYRLYAILGVYIDEKGLPSDFQARNGASGTPERDDQGVEIVRVDSYSGLADMLMRVFGPPEVDDAGDPGHDLGSAP